MRKGRGVVPGGEALGCNGGWEWDNMVCNAAISACEREPRRNSECHSWAALAHAEAMFGHISGDAITYFGSTVLFDAAVCAFERRDQWSRAGKRLAKMVHGTAVRCTIMHSAKRSKRGRTRQIVCADRGDGGGRCTALPGSWWRTLARLPCPPFTSSSLPCSG